MTDKSTIRRESDQTHGGARSGAGRPRGPIRRINLSPALAQDLETLAIIEDSHPLAVLESLIRAELARLRKNRRKAADG